MQFKNVKYILCGLIIIMIPILTIMFLNFKKNESKLQDGIYKVQQNDLYPNAYIEVKEGSPGQHIVFGGDPAFALTLQEGGHRLFHRGVADDLGVAAGDENTAFGIDDIVGLDGHRTDLGGLSAVMTCHIIRPPCCQRMPL